MNGTEFREIQAELGLSNAELANALDSQERTVEDFRQPDRVIKGPVVALMRVFQAAYRKGTPALYDTLIAL